MVSTYRDTASNMSWPLTSPESTNPFSRRLQMLQRHTTRRTYSSNLTFYHRKWLQLVIKIDLTAAFFTAEKKIRKKMGEKNTKAEGELNFYLWQIIRWQKVCLSNKMGKIFNHICSFPLSFPPAHRVEQNDYCIIRAKRKISFL